MLLSEKPLVVSLGGIGKLRLVDFLLRNDILVDLDDTYHPAMI